MSVDSRNCCYCERGYGVLVEIDATKLARARGERPQRPCRVPAHGRGRWMSAMRRLLSVVTARGKAAA